MTEQHPIAATLSLVRDAIRRAYEVGAVPHHVVKIADEESVGKVSPEYRELCRTRWSIGDVNREFDVTGGEALEFLDEISDTMTERLGELGNEIIDQLGREKGLTTNQEVIDAREQREAEGK